MGEESYGITHQPLRRRCVMTAGGLGEEVHLERRVNRLASERAALFDKSGASFGLSAADQERLSAIERELDDCFVLRRTHRAARNAQRFATFAPSALSNRQRSRR
jgi:hypothetical protein